jgi:hypothetical protein
VYFGLDSDPRPVLEVLLTLGADINAYIDETNALLRAVWHCDVEVVEWLILHGADVDFVYRQGMDKETALDFAFTDQQISESDPNCGYPPPEEYELLIDMMPSRRKDCRRARRCIIMSAPDNST